MNTISVKVIAERIAESIISSSYISKDIIIEKVSLNLKIWHKVTNRPVNYDKIKTDKGKQQYTIEKKDIELEFWRSKMKLQNSNEEMQKMYTELKSFLFELDYKT